MIFSVQLNNLTKDNTILVEKLRISKIMYNNIDDDNKEILFSKNDPISATSAKTYEEAVTGSLDKSLQAGILWIFLNLYDKWPRMSLD
jgi:hypothetical protein